MKVNGIHFPFGGINWDVDKQDSVLATTLIDFLEGKRVLYNECRRGCQNCRERSAKSVLDIKDFTTEMLCDLPKETDFKRVVRYIRQESNIFLNDIDTEDTYFSIINSRNKTFCPLLGYRETMAKHILEIMDMFDIRDIGELSCLVQENIK
jgi:hypothetical protein